jgi:hypothetical protein
LQAALRLASRQLDRAGIAFVALKSPRLAWLCYPEAGLRPMRDLDLLVAVAEVERAAKVLNAAGFAMASGEAAIAESLNSGKHLPPLWNPELAVEIVLHHRLTDLPGNHAYRVPQLDPGAALAGAETLRLAGISVPCPTPTELLAHLMIHALYGHRLDCGPLILADIHYLLATDPIDAETFHRRAKEGGGCAVRRC